MPALSPTMTAGNIGTWQKKVGDVIAPGDVLVEIETDKAQMDFEFQEEGVIAKVLKEAGEKDVAVGTVSFSVALPSLEIGPCRLFPILKHIGSRLAHRRPGRRGNRHRCVRKVLS